MIFKQRLFTVLLGLLFATVLTDQSSALYDPGVGRFCSRDPIGYAETSWNLSEFLNSKSLDNVDYSGNIPEITVKRIESTSLSPHCDLPKAWATFRFELSECPCRGNIGYFVQKVSVACSIDPCDHSLAARTEDGLLLTSEDYDYFEAWKVTNPGKGKKVSVKDKAQFELFEKSRGRYRQDGKVKFYCLAPDGVAGRGEIIEEDTSSPGSGKFGKLCQTESGALHATQHNQKYLGRPAAAEGGGRTFGMNWNCCCGKPSKFASAFARPK